MPINSTYGGAVGVIYLTCSTLRRSWGVLTYSAIRCCKILTGVTHTYNTIPGIQYVHACWCKMLVQDVVGATSRVAWLTAYRGDVLLSGGHVDHNILV